MSEGKCRTGTPENVVIVVAQATTFQALILACIANTASSAKCKLYLLDILFDIAWSGVCVSVRSSHE